MSLEAGHKLAHYEILELVGRGGMGEVYRAKDSKLGRDVAIKVLPDEFAQDEERLRRFQREAKVLASLNHPNIAAIYGLEQSGETHYLVLELVPGETLADRITRGRIPIEEALEIAKKIAEALEEAHERGIVHRDLKPANVKLTPDDKVKVLDFGLAKAFAEEGAEGDASSSMSPTITRDATRVGVILGTAAYMSPEQAKGKRVDRRTDIFAFGAVLYEMLTGRKAFAGEDVSEVLAAVIKQEPEWGALPNEVPLTVHRMIRRCLSKDRSRRLQHVGDARLEIEDAGVAVVDADGEPRRFNVATLVSIVLAVMAIGTALWSLSRSAPPARTVTRAVIPVPPAEEFLFATTSDIAISPDGQNVAYIATSGDAQKLYLRAMDELDAEPIADAENASMPFFSPDSQWLGFLSGGNLMKVAVTGGASLTIGEVGGNIRGATWTSAGHVVFNTRGGEGLSLIRGDSGESQILTTPDRDRQEKSHRFPERLPGGKKILFTIARSDIDSFDDAAIAVLSLESGEYTVVLEGGAHARYSPTGHLIYAHAGSLLAVPFESESSRVTGSPVPVIEGVTYSPNFGSAQFAISENGSLVYARGGIWGTDRKVVWVDRSGRLAPLVETPREYAAVNLSPDGRLLALYVEGANANIWLHDIARATSTRLTFGFDNYAPVWAPDGRRIAFATSRTNPASVYWQAADGSADAEPVAMGENPLIPSSWSPEGSILALLNAGDIDYLSLDGDGTPTPFLHTSFFESQPKFSPDGRWMAYQSNESGQPEIYLRAFPSGAGKQQVSTGGGQSPVWNPNGDELFYLDADKLMAVDVDTDGELTLAEPRVLFEMTLAQPPSYSVTRDGQRFVMILPGASESATRELILVQNWFDELERLVPTDN